MNDPQDTADTITLALVTPTEVLLLQRNPEPQPDYIDPQGGMWGLISGHIHKGEPSIDAVHREAEEETGIVGLQPHYIATLPFTCKGSQAANWVYAAFSIARVEVTLSNEHVDYQWVPITEEVHVTLMCRHTEILQMIHKRMSELH